MRKPLALVAALLSVCSCCSAQAGIRRHPAARNSRPPARPALNKAELIFFNANIYTGVGFAEDQPQVVQAMAIRGGRVVAVGTNADVMRLAGPATRLRDLDSAKPDTFLFPGFNDAHTHLGEGGQTRLNLDLSGATSLDDMLTKIAVFAQPLADGHWITGGRWDHTLWAEKSLPTRQDVDKASDGHPLFLRRVDGHIGIANSAALAAANITRNTAPPQGGAIDLDPYGEPTGILRESAMDLVGKVIPPPTSEERRRGAELAIADAVAHGVTSVQDNSDWQDFLAFEQMEKDGKLNVRITEWLPFSAALDDLKSMRAHHEASDPMLHTGMLKGFMDGSLGSRTAAMKAPFADEAGNSGLPQYKQDDLDRMAAERAQAGFQLGFHAIGDQAAAMALDAFGQPAVTAAARNRIEHAQVVDPADIPRFKKLGVIASMQPNHLLTDMNWAEDRLGPQRAAHSYAWKAFLDAGVPLAFGTDYPVEPITPFRGLYAAVTRRNEAGTKQYYPANKLTRGQALAAYTQGSAYAECAETHKGKLLPGFDADFILVDRDLYKTAAPDILQIVVKETYVSGKEVFPTM